MDIDRQKQRKAIAHTNLLLNSTENKRMLLRFQRGVVDLENNRFTILQNREFVDKLIDYLLTLYKKGNEGNIIKVLEKIGLSACSPDRDYRERAVFILSVFTEKVSQEKESAEFLEVVSRLLVNWLKIETEFLTGFEFVCTQLQKILQRMLKMGLWYQAENLIIVLFQIQSGIIQKNNLIRQMITKVHAGLADEPFLRNLVNVYLDKQEDRRDIAECLLRHFGAKAAIVLVQTLIECQEREKRLALVELIPTTGRAVIPVLDRCLEKNPPWYVIRNIIIIISRMEDSTLYTMVKPYLVHKDIRVQQQVLNCISKLGGNQMRERLIEALTFINDELKQQVVIQLGNLGGKDIGDALCSLLEKRHSFAIHIQDELLLAICSKIKFIPSPRTIQAMQELLAERTQRYGEGDRILQAAQDALVSLELKSTEIKEAGSFAATVAVAPQSPEAELDSLLTDSLLTTKEQMKADPATPVSPQQEEDPEVEQPAVVEEGDRPSKADIIRDAEKNLADPTTANHFTIWAELYEEMSTEEFTAFHETLSHKTYQPEEMIVASGDLQAPLFFLDRGTVDLVRKVEGEEVHLSSLGAGDVIGSDIFLTGDAWNISLYARDKVYAHIFDLEDLLKLQVHFPHLAEKLFAFCSSYDVLPALLRVLDEPDSPGFDTVRILRNGIQKKDETKDGELQGSVLKKMKGGLCFTLSVNASDKIGVLLENQLRLGIQISAGADLSLAATIIGTRRITSRPEEAIVFIRFFQPLPEDRYTCKSIEFPKSV